MESTMNLEPQLTQEFLHEAFEYKDGNIHWKLRTFRTRVKGKIAGQQRTDGYVAVGINGKIYKVHRIIFMMHHGYFPQTVDHINGIKYDNRIENLRAATISENCLNRGLRSDNVAHVKGVKWMSDTRKWRVRVTANKKRLLIGDFKDLELAELVAIEARNKYHKQFANHG